MHVCFSAVVVVMMMLCLSAANGCCNQHRNCKFSHFAIHSFSFPLLIHAQQLRFTN
jgi:hypothetical protein